MSDIKQILVRIAGQGRAEGLDVHDKMTANDVKKQIGCPMDYELSPTVGEPPFAPDEEIFHRLRDGGKLIAAPKADAGR